MRVEIKTISEFDRRLKRLAKKYKSIASDYSRLLDSLEQDPLQGVSLGMGE